MRDASAYRGARRNKWHETQACRWDESAYRFAPKVKTFRHPPVRPNKAIHAPGSVPVYFERSGAAAMAASLVAGIVSR